MHAAVDKRSGSSSVVEEDHHVVLRASASRRRQEQQAKMRGSESRHSAHCSLASSPGTSNGSGAIVVVETDASSSKVSWLTVPRFKSIPGYGMCRICDAIVTEGGQGRG